jgi:hypothetical protein
MLSSAVCALREGMLSLVSWVGLLFFVFVLVRASVWQMCVSVHAMSPISRPQSPARPLPRPASFPLPGRAHSNDLPQARSTTATVTSPPKVKVQVMDEEYELFPT